MEVQISEDELGVYKRALRYVMEKCDKEEIEEILAIRKMKLRSVLFLFPFGLIKLEFPERPGGFCPSTLDDAFPGSSEGVLHSNKGDNKISLESPQGGRFIEKTVGELLIFHVKVI